MPNLLDWHHRGGMSGLGAVGAPNQVYISVDPETGEQTPYVIGQDANGYPVLLDPSSVAPWQAGLISKSLDLAGGLFGSRPYQNSYYGNTALTATAGVTPSGAGAGFSLSSNTMLLIGLGLVLFLTMRGRR